MKTTAILLLFASLLQADQVGPFTTATPESQGMSSKKLDAMKADLAARKTKALLVIRNDKIVYEWYAEGHSAAAKHYTASMAKAIVAGVSVGVALTDNRLALDDPSRHHNPALRGSDRDAYRAARGGRGLVSRHRPRGIRRRRVGRPALLPAVSAPRPRGVMASGRVGDESS